jgi:hypothetical protein
MKNKKLLLTATLLVTAMLAFGQQEYAFKVLVNKGKNEVKSGDSWQPVKTGSSLKSGDELRITENSYIGLIHVTGKPLEVKQAGKYMVADLAGKIKEGASVLNKYTDFILSANTQKKNTLSATGAVHRGPENIKINLPKAEAAIVYNNIVIFNWEIDKAPAPYIVSFNSMFGDELKKIETNDNSVSIDLNDVSFANEDNIIVKVTSKADANKQSDEYTLKKLSKADKERIKNSLNEFKAVVAEPTAINKLVLAGFYESNNLFIDAITAYQEAIKLAPDVSEYKLQYNDFLLRNAIKEPPIKK